MNELVIRVARIPIMSGRGTAAANKCSGRYPGGTAPGLLKDGSGRHVKRKGHLVAALVAISPIAFADGKACDLTSPDELQATIGVKPNLKGSVLPNGVEVCTGKAGLSTVTIRLYPKKDGAEQEKEETKLEALEKAGAPSRRGGSERSLLRATAHLVGKRHAQGLTTSCTPPRRRGLQSSPWSRGETSHSVEMRKLAALAGEASRGGFTEIVVKMRAMRWLWLGPYSRVKPVI